MVTRAKLKEMGRMGFSDEDYAEWLKRSVARREDIQAHEVTLREMTEAGATGRVGMAEAGLGKRQRAGFEFERPGEVAETRESVARAERAEYGLGFEKGLEGTLKDIVGQERTKGQLDIDVLTEELRKLTAKPEVAPTVEKKAVAKPAAAKKRKLRPSIKRFMWEGTPTKSGLRLPGLLAPAYGYKNIADWLGHFAKKGYEYAYPRGR